MNFPTCGGRGSDNAGGEMKHVSPEVRGLPGEKSTKEGTLCEAEASSVCMNTTRQHKAASSQSLVPPQLSNLLSSKVYITLLINYRMMKKIGRKLQILTIYIIYVYRLESCHRKVHGQIYQVHMAKNLQNDALIFLETTNTDFNVNGDGQ